MTKYYRDLTIAIPTYNRVGRVTTLKAIPPYYKSQTRLVVRESEEEAYYESYNDLIRWVLPAKTTNLSQTRQHILDVCKTRYLLMLDDDLKFSMRSMRHKNLKSGNFYYPLQTLGKGDFSQMINTLMQKMQEENLAHVAVSAQEGNNRKTVPWGYNERYMRAYLFDLSVVRYYLYSNACCGTEDFDMALQLITTGHKVAVCYLYAQGQGTSNAKGGLSTYRTIEYQNNAMRQLALRYPQFVKLKEKTTKRAWGGATRVDATIHWKKAFNTAKLIGAECPPAQTLHP